MLSAKGKVYSRILAERGLKSDENPKYDQHLSMSSITYSTNCAGLTGKMVTL